MLPPGWTEVDTGEGPILLNPDQVAYVREIPDQEPVPDLAG